ALRHVPHFGDAWLNKGLVLDRVGRWEEAAACYTNAVNTLPVNKDKALNNLGVVFTKMERHEMAAKAFQQALQINPAHIQARSNLQAIRGMSVEKIQESGSSRWRQGYTSPPDTLPLDYKSRKWIIVFQASEAFACGQYSPKLCRRKIACVATKSAKAPQDAGLSAKVIKSVAKDDDKISRISVKNNAVEWRAGEEDSDVGQEYDERAASWESIMLEFWESRNCRKAQVSALLEQAEELESLRNPEQVAACLRKLSLLLPDSHGIDMLEREPECLHKIDMVPAAHMILDLQAFLDRDSISSVTQIFQRCPSLLWQKSAAVLVEAATARIEEIEPRADALTVVKENPDLLYRITRYTRWSELPIDIQNMLTDAYEDTREEAIDAWNDEWDLWEMEHGDNAD
ncbi:hypothetical protein CYMTET_11968, partial [Cymbomonas tetramitiformis]